MIELKSFSEVFMFSLLFDYVKKHKWVYLFALVALVIYDITLIMPTKIVQSLIDMMTQRDLTRELLLQNIFLLIGIVILNYVTGYIWGVNIFRSSSRFKTELQEGLFAKLIRMRKPFFEKFRSGDMLTRFSSDVESIEELLGYGLMTIVYAGGMIIFIIPTMLFISWQITLLSLMPLLTMIVVMYFIGQYLEKKIERNRDAVGVLNNGVLETVEGVRVIRAYSQKEMLGQDFRSKTQSLREENDAIIIVQATYGPAFVISLTLSTVIVLGLGASFVQTGQITLGQVLALQLYIVSLLEPFSMVSDFILVYQVAKISFNKVIEVLETSDDLEADGELGIEHIERIDFKKYSFTYPNASQPSLVGIESSILSGQTIGLVGPTGSGKSTFVKQLLRQYRVGTGDLLVNGKPITCYQKKAIENLIGYVPQEHILFSKTVAENIAMGGVGVSERDILTAVETADFTKDLANLSDGLATQIGENGVSISGGQKQRISIARAFIRDPELLILDDSLSAVDAKTEQQIIANIQAKRSGKTTLIVTHRLSAVMHADKILVLDKGRIIASGTSEELLAEGGWYAQQYDRQKLESKEDA